MAQEIERNAASMAAMKAKRAGGEVGDYMTQAVATAQENRAQYVRRFERDTPQPVREEPLRESKITHSEETNRLFREYTKLTKLPKPKAAGYKSSHWEGTPNVLAHIRMDERTDADGKRVLFVQEIQSDWGQDKRGGKDVPDAPFIGKTSAWVALALKRVARMAADEGFDRVALVNGEQAAEMFDLSKRVGEVRVERYTLPETGAVADVRVMDLDGKQMHAADGATMQEVADLIGKELAAKIEAQADDSIHIYEGGDLTVGGEGMREFYDKIVPNVVRDVLRKLGGDGLTTTTMRGAVNAGFDITPVMKAKASAGMPLFSRSTATKSAYESRIDALFADTAKASRDGVRVLDSSDVVGLLGFAHVPLVLNESHITHDGRTNHPEMTAAMWKKVPEWLENPAAVYTDPKHPGKLTIVAPVRVAGYPVVIAVEPNTLRGKPDHLLVTAFAKTTGDLPAYGYLRSSGRLLYADTKKAPDVWRLIGDNPRPSHPAPGAKRILTEKQLGGYRRANNPAYSFAGQQAQSADQHALSTAQQRLDSGDDAEAVRRDTGWHKGVDGKWRFEISDADAKLHVWTDAVSVQELRDANGGQWIKPEQFVEKYPEHKLSRRIERAGDLTKRAHGTRFAGSVQLGELLEHPALFAAYPGLARIRVLVQNTVPIGQASFHPQENAIVMGPAKSEAALSTLLHEIQHGIQHIEGFATGGSPDSVFLQDGDFSKYRNLSQKMLGEFSEPTQKERQEYEALFDKLRKQKLIDKNGNFVPGYQAYTRLAGEVEARNTEARQGMSDAERRATSPESTADVKTRDVIVTFNGQQAQSAPAPANAPLATRQSPAGLADTAAVRDAIAAKFPDLAGAIDRMIERGDKGQEGGLVVIESAAARDIAQVYASKTDRSLETALRQIQGDNPDVQHSGAGDIQGFYDPKSGLQFIVAPNVSAQTVPAVVLHEAVHGQQRADLDAKAQKLLDDRHNKIRPAKTREFLSRVAHRIDDSGETGNTKEVMPYIVEQAVLEGRQAGFSKADGKFLDWVDATLGQGVGNIIRDLVATIRASALKRGFDLTPTMDDLVALAKMAVRTAADGTVVTAKPRAAARAAATALSRKQAEAADNTEAERQFKETERAHGGRAAYDRAKAAGTTKLNYGQWVQVRTPKFRAWFGDWQAVRAQERLDAMKPLTVRVPDAWRGLAHAELRAKVREALDEMVVSGEPLHHPEIGAVGVQRKGAKKALHSSADPAKLYILGDLRKAFESSIFASSVSPVGGEPNVVAYEKLIANVDVDGIELVATFTVQRHSDGGQFYNTVVLQDKEKPQRDYPRDTPAQDGERAQTAISRVSDFVRRSLARVNPGEVSKVVDPATGEPLVVYHGTARDFDAFDNAKTGANDKGLWGRGHYFASAPTSANSYALRQGDGARVIPAYVSIQNPLVLRTGRDLVTRLPDGTNTRELIGQNLDGAKIKAMAIEGGHDGVIQIKSDGSIGDVVAFTPTQIKSATGNNGNFDGADGNINHFGAKPQPATGSKTDRAVMDMVREGQSAKDVLGLVAATSKSRFNRQVAKLLLKTGINPALVHATEDMGGKDGFKFLAKYSRKDNAVHLTDGAQGQAEQIVLHELMHAATLAALDRKGLHSLQMRRLFEHVKKNGGLGHQYGLKNVGEFVAEAFTNPEFQRALKGMSAPSGGTLNNAWDGLVRILRSILGLPLADNSALSQALELGVAVMREDMAVRQRMAQMGKPSARDDAAHFGTDDQSIRFSRSKPTAIQSSMGAMTPAQEQAYQRVAGTKKVPTWQERADSFKANLGLKLRQGLVDQFAAIKQLDQTAYMQARMSKASDGTLEAVLLYGKIFLRDGVPDVKIGDGGFAEVLGTLKGEHDRFLTWVAAHRAERLKADDKENLMTNDDISALKTLNAGKMADGTLRVPVYAKALQELNAYNDAMLKMAMESGLIDQAAFDLMKDQPYVPFYRLMEEEGGMGGPKFSSGLMNQKAWQKLKGGTQQLNADLLQNMLMNWSHLLQASAKNRAALATMDAAEKMAVAYKVPATTNGLATKGAVKVMRDGNTEHWMIEDPYLLEAVSALNYTASPLMKPLAKMKQILTWGVTVNPTFKIRNLIRDSVSAIAQSELGYNPAANVAKGWKLTASDSQIYASMLASGGVIKFGTQENTDRLRAQVKKLGGVVLDKNGAEKLTSARPAASWQKMGPSCAAAWPM